MDRRLFLGALGSPLALGAVSGCGGKYWENAAPTQSVIPDERHYPDSAAELMEIIARATQTQRRVRMTGSGHSFSDVAITKDILLSPNCLDQPLELDRQRLKNPSEPLLARVMSGISVRQLNDHLDAQGMALRNMGGYDAQTIVGAAITGTHGSGLNYGPIASEILSLQVVGTGGKMIQIEPTDGMTDPRKFPGRLEEDESIDVELLQNDEIFNAVTVSMGCMGVVYSVILRTDRKFWLREVRTVRPWAELKKPGGVIDRMIRAEPLRDSGPQPEYYEIYFNPYLTGGKQDRTCLWTERFKSYEPLVAKNPEEKTRGQFGTNFFTAMAVLFEPALLDFVSKNPKKIPEIIETALGGLRDKSYVNKSYRVFNIGVANRAKVYGIELGFDLTQTVAATERVFQIAAELRKKNILHNAPPSLRFVAPSKAHIAMQAGRRTMMLEIGQLVGAHGAEDLFWTYQTKFMTEFAARPHWGLDLGIIQSADWPAYLYPKWKEWMGVYQRLNAAGTFDGRFTDRLGISVRPRSAG